MQVGTIAEQLFFTTVRIDTVAMDDGRYSGTGFLFKHKVGEQCCPFVVTNKHVVNGMTSVALTFLQRDDQAPRLGQGYRLATEEIWPHGWFGHPSPDVDIAVCPFAPLEDYIKQQINIDLFYKFVDNRMIPDEKKLKSLDAIESVTFIGYPNGIWDSKNLLPIARRGTTASPIEVDFEGKPLFIVDASVFGGSSGSPVFILNQRMWADREGNNVCGSRLMFVGVIAEVFYRTQMNQIVAVPIPTQVQPMVQQQEMLDLGIVFKARTVVETIEAFFKAYHIDTTAPAFPQPPTAELPKP